MADPITILSIDGGGIRGIIPAILLAEFERRAARPIAELFDLISGTSTGGILALALSAPGTNGEPRFSAENLVHLYLQEGPNIFSRSVWRRIRVMDNLLEERYTSKGIETVLRKYLTNARLSQALTEILIPSYEIERRVPFFFRSRHARNPEKKGWDFHMKDVAMATSAAPTYFEPALIRSPDLKQDRYALVDGGVFANNPALCAYSEALHMMNTKRQPVLLVSLGTGKLTRPLLFQDVKDWGLIHWAQPLLDVTFHGMSKSVDFQLRQLIGPEHYYRFNVSLEHGNDDFDDASDENMETLRSLAVQLIEEREDEIETLADKLRKVAEFKRGE